MTTKHTPTLSPAQRQARQRQKARKEFEAKMRTILLTDPEYKFVIKSYEEMYGHGPSLSKRRKHAAQTVTKIPKAPVPKPAEALEFDFGGTLS